MNSLPLLFSSYDYFKNTHFQWLQKNWNVYLQSDEPQEQVLVEWEEILLNDFLESAREWLWQNKHWTDEKLI